MYKCISLLCVSLGLCSLPSRDLGRSAVVTFHSTAHIQNLGITVFKILIAGGISLDIRSEI